MANRYRHDELNDAMPTLPDRKLEREAQEFRERRRRPPVAIAAVVESDKPDERYFRTFEVKP